MKKLLFFLTVLSFILSGVSCEKDPVKEFLNYRNKYIVKGLGFNLVRDENGDPAYLNVEFAIENKNSKPVLKYLTLKIQRFDVRDNMVGEDIVVVDVSDLGGFRLKRYLKKIPNKLRGIKSILVKKVPADYESGNYKNLKEFKAGLNL